MPDYKEMYLKLFRASEKAVNIMIHAQQECEEMFLSAPDAEVTILPAEKRRAEKGAFGE